VNTILIKFAFGFQPFVKDLDKDAVVLYAARASRTENQDAIDASIVAMLADPSEVCDAEPLV
jgi:hypothetical protein